MKRNTLPWTHAVQMMLALLHQIRSTTIFASARTICFAVADDDAREYVCTICWHGIRTTETVSEAASKHLVLNEYARHIFIVHHLYCVWEAHTAGNYCYFYYLAKNERKKKWKREREAENLLHPEIPNARHVINNFRLLAFHLLYRRSWCVFSDGSSTSHICYGRRRWCENVRFPRNLPGDSVDDDFILQIKGHWTPEIFIAFVKWWNTRGESKCVVMLEPMCVREECEMCLWTTRN